jgi:hypothetical protein
MTQEGHHTHNISLKYCAYWHIHDVHIFQNVSTTHRFPIQETSEV